MAHSYRLTTLLLKPLLAHKTNQTANRRVHPEAEAKLQAQNDIQIILFFSFRISTQQWQQQHLFLIHHVSFQGFGFLPLELNN